MPVAWVRNPLAESISHRLMVLGIKKLKSNRAVFSVLYNPRRLIKHSPKPVHLVAPLGTRSGLRVAGTPSTILGYTAQRLPPSSEQAFSTRNDDYKRLWLLPDHVSGPAQLAALV